MNVHTLKIVVVGVLCHSPVEERPRQIVDSILFVLDCLCDNLRIEVIVQEMVQVRLHSHIRRTLFLTVINKFIQSNIRSHSLLLNESHCTEILSLHASPVTCNTTQLCKQLENCEILCCIFNCTVCSIIYTNFI